LQNNKFECLECRDDRFSLLKENNESICIYLPELNGYADDFYIDIEYFLGSIYNYYYNFYISHYFSHCKEVINLGKKIKLNIHVINAIVMII